jgi:hypothetical protein
MFERISTHTGEIDPVTPEFLVQIFGDKESQDIVAEMDAWGDAETEHYWYRRVR